jgi:chemotaxis response regulator CheB
LAEDVKERAVAVILSGTGTDGVDGARAIKAGRASSSYRIPNGEI